MIFWAVISFLVFTWVLGLSADYLNVKTLKSSLPEEFKGYYDAEKYSRSQSYLKENTRLSLVHHLTDAGLILWVLFSGFLDNLDASLRAFGYSEPITGLLYIGCLIFGYQLLSLPFSYYQTFVIEKKYDFNKSTPLIFFTDLLKGTVLTILLGAPLLYLILRFFEVAGPYSWLMVWGIIVFFQLIIMFLAPILIMPLFNKFDPLQDSDLKEKIESYAKKESFALKGVYQMDGSKRSSKSNAFFTGFGGLKRIVLFDTLIEKHTHEELLAIVAHEMGHYKKRHILKMLFTSIFLMGITLYLLQLSLNTTLFIDAFNVAEKSTYMGLILFSMVFMPVNLLTGLYSSKKSRKYEFEADAYAVHTTGLKEDFIEGLKKLSVNNLSNLTPHWLKVTLEYSHPPVLQRIKQVKKI